MISRLNNTLTVLLQVNYLTVFDRLRWSKYFGPFNILYTGKPLPGTLAKSEDPDERPNKAALYQGLHCLLRLKQKHHNLENATCDLLKYSTYCINIFGKIHQITKNYRKKKNRREKPKM